MPLAHAAGLVVLIIAMWDILYTTTFARGSGPLTGALCKGMSSAITRLGSSAASGSTLISYSGGVTLCATLLFWVLLYWGGWSLVFLGMSGSVVSASSSAPADAGERVYYAGYVISTLGLGDFRPVTGLARAYTVLGSIGGLMIFTLAISYIVSVLKAVAEQRSLASRIHDLGETPQKIIIGGWNGTDFSALMNQFNNVIWPSLTAHTQNHFVYPVIHQFRSCREDASIGLAAARLNECVFLLEHIVEREKRPQESKLRPVSRAIQRLLDTLESTGLPDSGKQTPPPEFSQLSAHGLTHDTPEVNHSGSRDSSRKLAADAGWSWESVVGLHDKPLE